MRGVHTHRTRARRYNQSVDWFSLGVLMYVLLTARQPFTSPKSPDPMEVMRRIVDERWPIRYAPYSSDEAQDLMSRLLERRRVFVVGVGVCVGGGLGLHTCLIGPRVRHQGAPLDHCLTGCLLN
jgi:serine/threonine protein kinase